MRIAEIFGIGVYSPDDHDHGSDRHHDRHHDHDRHRHHDYDHDHDRHHS